MFPEKLNLAEIISMAQVFRVELNRWPVNAAELFVFSLAWGKPLDFSGLHTLVFTQEDPWSFGMEYAVSKRGEERVSCGRLELRRIGQTDMEMTFAWKTKHLSLPSKKVESAIYCFAR